MKTWIVEQKEGRPVFTNFQRADFHDYCLKNPKAKFRLEVVENTRTMSQNRLYWLYLGVIERETGQEAKELHEFFKREFLVPKFIKVMGKEIEIYPSTTTMKKLEFSEYLEKICAKTEVPIPDTNAYNAYYETAPLKEQE